MSLHGAIYTLESPAFNDGKRVIIYHPKGFPPVMRDENIASEKDVALVIDRARGSKVLQFDAETGEIVHEFNVI